MYLFPWFYSLELLHRLLCIFSFSQSYFLKNLQRKSVARRYKRDILIPNSCNTFCFPMLQGYFNEITSAIHSIKNFGLNFRKFSMTSGTQFPEYPEKRKNSRGILKFA